MNSATCSLRIHQHKNFNLVNIAYNISYPKQKINDQRNKNSFVQVER